MPAGDGPLELALVLHAHLPWVRDPEAIEERWLFEAMLECYLPLVDLCERLDREGVPGALVISVSPTLLAMLRDEALRARFEKHFAKLSGLLADARARLEARFAPALAHHDRRLQRAWAVWTRHRGDLVEALGALRRSGRLSLWTSAYPHPLLPLWSERRWFLDAAIERSISLHCKHFGAPPAGHWLPECGVAPGVLEALRGHGVEVTVLETHSVLLGVPRPTGGVARPVRDPSGVIVAARDPHAAAEVWSREQGYPGAPRYQDFSSDLGHGPWEGFTGPDGAAWRTGIGVFAVTDRRGGSKVAYDPEAAIADARAHGRDFVEARVRSLRAVGGGLSCCPYDAELFGHWWSEGPDFLEAVLRAAAPRGLRCVALDQATAVRATTLEAVRVAPGTWGRGGHLAPWLDGPAAYMARAVEHMARAVEAAGATGATEPLEALLRSSASDWPFLLNGGGAPHYARRRFDADRAWFWRALGRELARRG